MNMKKCSLFFYLRTSYLMFTYLYQYFIGIFYNSNSFTTKIPPKGEVGRLFKNAPAFLNAGCGIRTLVVAFIKPYMIIIFHQYSL